MEKAIVMLANYKTTALGFAVGVLFYLEGVGPKAPASTWEWMHLVVCALLAGLGYAAKDATTGSKPLVALLALGLAVSGCTTVQADAQRVVTDFSTMTLADIDRALAMAALATDPGAPYRARCYGTLRKYVPNGQTVAEALLPNGVVSTYEAAAELDARLRSGAGIPSDVHADCAIIAINLAEFAGRVGLKVAPIPGATLLQSVPLLK